MGEVPERVDAARRAGLAASREAPVGAVVLGAGRSGTSAISRAFVLSGFHAGADEDLLGPHPSNPLGHFEPLPILRANEELMEELAASWPMEVPAAEEQARIADDAFDRLKGLVRSLAETAGGAPVVVKEPRISALLTIWQPVIEETLHPVLAIRDPIEIAVSQERRDGTTLGHVLAGWEAQTTRLLRWLNGRTVTIAPYARLIDEPQLAERVVAAAASHLDPAVAARVDAERAPSALRSDLHHERAERFEYSDYLTARQASLWQYLRELPAGDVELEVDPKHCEPGEAAASAMRKESERVRLEKDHAALIEEHALLAEERAKLDWRIEVLEDRLATATRTELARAEELAGMRASASWRITAPLRKIKSWLRRSGSRGREPAAPASG